jgi:hypothetical protein
LVGCRRERRQESQETQIQDENAPHKRKGSLILSDSLFGDKT